MIDLTPLSFRNVLHFVKPSQVWALKRVCKRFNKEISDGNLWKTLMRINHSTLPPLPIEDCEEAMLQLHRSPREKSINDFEFQVVHGQNLIYHWKNGNEKYSLTEELKFQISDYLLLELKKPDPLTLYIIYTPHVFPRQAKKFRKITCTLEDVDESCLDFHGDNFEIYICDASDDPRMGINVFGGWDVYLLGDANEEFV